MVVKKKTKIKKPIKKEKEEKKKSEITRKVLKKEDSSEKAIKKYFEAVGRRKTSIARVRLFSCSPFEGDQGQITINEKPYTKYFPTLDLQNTIEAALKKMKSLNRFIVTIRVRGGGIRGQAEAIRHGISRALVKFNLDFRKKLKRAGFLRRDPRMVERKKPGLKKARRAPQWKKR